MAIYLFEPQSSPALKCGNLHGAPVIKSPTPKLHRRHFWGNEGEVEIKGGRVGREVMLNAILNDSSWTDTSKVYNYIKTSLESNLGSNGPITVTFPEAATAVFKFCTLERYELVTQPGHQHPAPLKDVTSQLNGTADTWWIEVNLYFHQLQIGITDSTFSAS